MEKIDKVKEGENGIPALNKVIEAINVLNGHPEPKEKTLAELLQEAHFSIMGSVCSEERYFIQLASVAKDYFLKKANKTIADWLIRNVHEDKKIFFNDVQKLSDELKKAVSGE